MIFEEWLIRFPEYKSWHSHDQKNLFKKYLRDTWTKSKFNSLSKEDKVSLTNEAIGIMPKCLTKSNSLIRIYTYMLVRKKYKCPYY